MHLRTDQAKIPSPVVPAFIVMLMLTVIIHIPVDDGSRSGAAVHPVEAAGTIALSADSRSDNVLLEDFSTIDNIDMTNTTVIIDTYRGQVRLKGMGTPRSNIRDVTQHDHMVNHNGFNSMAVDENGRYYHLDAGSGNTVQIFNDWSDYFQGRQHADTLQVPESQHSTQMFVANGYLYTSSESGDNLRKVRLADKAIVQSNINHPRTSNWGWRGPQQQGVACDGAYIYTWCDTTLKIWDLNENLLRTVNGLPHKQGYSTCFAVGHYFYCVQYSQARLTHRVDGDSGTIHQYTNEVFISNSYVVDASYDYFHNRLFAGLGWSNTYALDNVAQVWGNQEGFTNGTIQSRSLSGSPHSIGSVRVEYFEDVPADTRIVYNITNDGENWVRLRNGTELLFEELASELRWNASLQTNSSSLTPRIKALDIRWNLVDAPSLTGPSEEVWQGDPTPTLNWEFRDPDDGDVQSYYRLEIYDDEDLTSQVYDTDWVNSSDASHEVAENLSDGDYYWRVRTKDCRIAAGNFSDARKLMIDTTKPNGSIVIEGGAETVNDKLVSLSINGTDHGSGIMDMRIINERGAAGPWEEYAEEKGIALENVDGMKTMGVQFRDNAGIISDEFNDSIYLDLMGPGDMIITSPTHPDPGTYYNHTEPVFQWSEPPDMAGIKGYSHTFDDKTDTIPAKVLYTPNADVTETQPGDFPGLGDGTWYFHITPCDVYDQWGNTSHFRFNIDTTPPVLVESGPADNTWFNTSSVSVSAEFAEESGCGLDADSLEYSLASHGGTFGHWKSDSLETDIERDGSDNVANVKGTAVLELPEGSGNRIRWRCADLAGNRYVAPATTVGVDITPVSFSTPVPSENEVFSDTSVTCGITVSDGGGSGVNGGSIEYCLSFFGDDDSLFQNWTPAGYSLRKDEIDVLLDLEFETGWDNYVRWRADDLAGTGMVVSEPMRVRINTAPLPSIESPLDDSQHEGGVPVILSANGSLDPDGDELSYYWEVKNASMKTVVLSASRGNAQATGLEEGAYIVMLWANDGFGQNISTRVRIYVKGEEDAGGGGGGGGGTGGGKIGGPLQGSSDGFPLIPVIIACSIVLILTVIAVFLILRRRRKKREETKTPPAPEVPAHPYPWGEYRPTDHQGYAPDQQNRGGTHQYGPVGTGLPAGPVPLLAPAPQHQQMLPQTGMGGLPGGAPPALMGSPNQLPYSLPPIQTDEGLQDLNTMALPPAPAGIPQIPEAGQTGAAVGGQTPVNDVPIAPAEGAEGQESDPLAELGSFLSEMAEGITAPASPPVPGPAQIPVRSPAIRPPDGTPAEAGDQAPYMAPSVESPAPVPIPASAPISPPRHMAPPTPPLVIPPPTSTEQSPSDPPEAAPSPGATPAPDTSPGEMSLACHSCGTTYTAVVTSFPALVQCPGCGTQGMLNG